MNHVTHAASARPGPRLVSWPKRTILGELTESSREALLSTGTPCQYSSGTTLIMEGDYSTYVVVLIDGWAKVTAATEDGGLALLALRSSGDLVGEQAALENQPRSASVISAGASLGRKIRQGDFLHLLATHPDIAIAVTRALSAKLRWATRRRIDFSGLAVPVRLARVLCELARLESKESAGGIELGYSLTQPELAAMVGASEPSVQRALRQLRADGVVDTGYRRITIRDPAALDALAGSAWTGGPWASGHDHGPSSE
jgi:CRP/FNR family transcriptional regulator, cyclic AMP receptor protein